MACIDAPEACLYDFLPSAVIVHLTMWLDPMSILNFATTCHFLKQTLLDLDAFIWSPILERMLKGKQVSDYQVAVANRIKADSERGGIRNQIKFLVQDSTRQSIMPDEIESLTWAFRFKECAGEFWSQLDPYWSDPDRKAFLRRKFTTVDGVNRVVSADGSLDQLELWAHQINLQIKWRINKTRHGTKAPNGGHYLQINKWPSMVIERDPVTWGWKIHNQWVAYISPCTTENLTRLHDELENDVARFC
ncbi:hypothetical protein TrLO_g4057 [Triparma laevis f. longispina]|uniref:F-box domain-containing protein n=1 Tax=Triparma laevis f. longispina TaxID=1714387 RepID=A0A9W7B2U4_9STRA|nr:hypothetical protein TrLO_g4057 [Triparma laevis f. longispina]